MLLWIIICYYFLFVYLIVCLCGVLSWLFFVFIFCLFSVLFWFSYQKAYQLQTDNNSREYPHHDPAISSTKFPMMNWVLKFYHSSPSADWYSIHFPHTCRCCVNHLLPAHLISVFTDTQASKNFIMFIFNKKSYTSKKCQTWKMS